MKRNAVIIIGAAVIVAAIILVFGYQRMTASASPTTRLQTANAQLGTLVATVSAAGNVSTPSSSKVSFQTSGTVTKVNVQVGDKVTAGQVLMELDTTNLQMALKTAQTSLTTAQNSYQSAQIAYKQLPNQIIAAKGALDTATLTLQQAQQAYNAVAWRKDVGITSQSAALQTATTAYNTALANYQVSVSNYNDTAVKSAKASVDQAQISVDQAQKNLDNAKLIAPISGYVSAVNYNVGDTASGTAVTLADISKLQVKVTIAEVDIAKIKAGQAAQMTLDALPGNTYNASVLEIGPVGTVTSGVVNYPVTVAITNTDNAIKPGMTANLAITVDQRDNVLTVPLRAVKTQGTQKVVTVLYQGQQIPVNVTTGLTSDTSAEITSGLKEGDVVVLNATQTRQTGGGGPGGFGAIFGR